MSITPTWHPVSLHVICICNTLDLFEASRCNDQAWLCWILLATSFGIPCLALALLLMLVSTVPRMGASVSLSTASL